MPTAVAAGIAQTALTAPVVAGGLGTALGTGLAAGSAMAGTGIFSNFMAGAAPGLAGSLGGVTPAVAANLAPAATSQLLGTIGGNVAPGAFGANLAGATPGLTSSAAQNLGLNALKSQVIGTGVQNAAAQQATNLAIQQAAAQNMAGGLANPMSQMGAKFLANSPPLAKPFAGETLIAGEGSPIAFQQAPQTANTFSEAGFKGLQKSGLNYPSLSNPTAQAVNPADIVGRSIRPNQNFMQNLGNIGSFQDVKDYAEQHPYATSAMAGLGAMGISKMLEPKKIPTPEDKSMIRPYTYERTQSPEAYATSPTMDSSERNYFNDQFIAGEPYKAAEGGIAAAYAVGGPVEQMAAMNAVGTNTGYPMANLQTPMYANPAMQRPEATNVVAPSADAGVGAYTGEARFAGGGGTQYGVTSNPNHVNPETKSRAELAGGRRPSTPTAPLPTYTYDPNTLQFTQTSAPRPVTKSSSVAPGGGPAFMGPVGSGHYGAGSYSENARLPGNTTATASMSVPTNIVTGGIASPAMGPMQTQQPQQAAPAYPALNIPAYQSPEQQLGLGGFYDMMNQQLGGYGGYAKGGNVGGEAHLGDYSDGGRLLRGPGDGVSDSIPASIGGRQPARLADGEFVVPARIVSELGNGSTEAGARKLYAMMERVQATRKKSIGKKKVAVNSKADKHLPA
jgi:hypothetical protein